jgi:hypothetical protein
MSAQAAQAFQIASTRHSSVEERARSACAGVFRAIAAVLVLKLQ